MVDIDVTEAVDVAADSTVAPEKRRLPWRSVALFVVVGLVLLMLTLGLRNTNAVQPTPGTMAPEFQMQYYDGYEWEGRSVASLSDMKGKVVVLNFWASWCVECRLEADLLESAWRQYQSQDVVFVGVAYVDVEAKAREYMVEFDVTYPNAPDLRSRVSDSYEITGVPETFIIDQTGEIVYVQIGPISSRELYSILDRLTAS